MLKVMLWENAATGETQSSRPSRVRLADGTTRTQEAITDDQLAEAGWALKEFEIDPDVAIVKTPESDLGN
jgi:hypothetical protein